MARPWLLVADIGGTHARFALADGAGRRILVRRVYRADAWPDLNGALRAFCADVADQGLWRAAPERACVAIASPQPEREPVTMTNSPWLLERERCADLLGLDALTVLNDFEAVGHAVATDPGPTEEILPGTVVPGAPRLVLGCGTGLGMACTIPGRAGRPQVLATEGGHVDLPVETDLEWSLLTFLRARFGHVSAERVLSGPGLGNLYAYFAACPEDRVPDGPTIVRLALDGADDAARQTVEQFCATLGAVVGNAVLTQGARGGVILVGAILEALHTVLGAGGFAERLHAKGRYRAYLEAVPVARALEPDLGLLGALRFLAPV